MYMVSTEGVKAEGTDPPRRALGTTSLTVLWFISIVLFLLCTQLGDICLAIFLKLPYQKLGNYHNWVTPKMCD